MALSVTFGRVVDNVDETGQGLIKVVVNEINPDNPLTAKPVFLSFNGWEGLEDEDAHRGSYFVPPIGAIVLIFYIPENLSEVYYFGSILPMDNYDRPALPETSLPDAHRRIVLARTETGQSIILSDANVDKGVRITGFKKKYNRNSPDSGLLEKEGNQSIVEIDGKSGDITIYSLNDITLKTDGGFIKLTKSGDLIIKASGTYTLEVPRTIEKTNARRDMCRCFGHSETSTRAQMANFSHRCGRCRR